MFYQGYEADGFYWYSSRDLEQVLKLEIDLGFFCATHDPEIVTNIISGNQAPGSWLPDELKRSNKHDDLSSWHPVFHTTWIHLQSP
jgi:hypothetical protein